MSMTPQNYPLAVTAEVLAQHGTSGETDEIHFLVVAWYSSTNGQLEPMVVQHSPPGPRAVRRGIPGKITAWRIL